MPVATENMPTAAQTKDGLFADPSGWSSNIVAADSVKRMLAGTIVTQTSDIKNVLEGEGLDQYIFSSKCSDIFYLFSSGNADIFQVVKPSTQKELWDVLQGNDWRTRLTLKEL